MELGGERGITHPQLSSTSRVAHGVRPGPKTNVNSTGKFLSCFLLVARATHSTRRTRQREKKGGWYVSGETGGELKKRPSISVR